jgi:hypothetical protein
MANAFKRYGLEIDAADTTLYTVPALKVAIVLGLRLANKDGINDATIEAKINDGTADRYIIGVGTSLPAGAAISGTAGEKIVMQAGDILKLKASAAGDVDAYISIMESDV